MGGVCARASAFLRLGEFVCVCTLASAPRRAQTSGARVWCTARSTPGSATRTHTPLPAAAAAPRSRAAICRYPLRLLPFLAQRLHTPSPPSPFRGAQNSVVTLFHAARFFGGGGGAGVWGLVFPGCPAGVTAAFCASSTAPRLGPLRAVLHAPDPRAGCAARLQGALSWGAPPAG